MTAMYLPWWWNQAKFLTFKLNSTGRTCWRGYLDYALMHHYTILPPLGHSHASLDLAVASWPGVGGFYFSHGHPPQVNSVGSGVVWVTGLFSLCDRVTHTHTRQAQAETIPIGQNWPKVKIHRFTWFIISFSCPGLVALDYRKVGYAEPCSQGSSSSLMVIHWSIDCQVVFKSYLI